MLTWFAFRVALSDFPKRVGRVLVEKLRGEYPGTGRPVWPTAGRLAECDAGWATKDDDGRPTEKSTSITLDIAANSSNLAALREQAMKMPQDRGLVLRSLIASIPDVQTDDLIELASENAAILAALLDGLDSAAQSREEGAFAWTVSIEEWTFGLALVDEVGRLVARPGLAMLPRRSN